MPMIISCFGIIIIRLAQKAAILSSTMLPILFLLSAKCLKRKGSDRQMLDAFKKDGMGFLDPLVEVFVTICLCLAKSG